MTIGSKKAVCAGAEIKGSDLFFRILMDQFFRKKWCTTLKKIYASVALAAFLSQLATNQTDAST